MGWKYLTLFKLRVDMINSIILNTSTSSVFIDSMKVVGLLMAGVLVGYLIRKRKKLVKINDKLTTYAIYVLLLLLGIAIGVNKQITENLPTLGVDALVLTIGAVGGSIVLALFVYIFFFKNKKS